MSKHNANNHSNQMNPNNGAYWSSRGTPAPSSSPAPTPAVNSPTPAPTQPAQK
ncbi:MAG: hypothetical protein ACO1OB_17980 [Archangium sp.]